MFEAYDAIALFAVWGHDTGKYIEAHAARGLP